MQNTVVIKRDGRKEQFDFNKILKHLKESVKDLSGVDYNDIIANLKLRMKPEMTSEEIQKALEKEFEEIENKSHKLSQTLDKVFEKYEKEPCE